MVRAAVKVTNVNSKGRVMSDRWTVRIGKEVRTFSEADWVKDGLAWVSARIAGDE
jgi:hypothetical protein